MKRTQSTTTLAFWMKHHCFNNEEYINKKIEEVQKELEAFKAQAFKAIYKIDYKE